MPPEVVRRVFAGIRRGPVLLEGPGELTPRQREIVALFSRGLSYAGIAEQRGVRPVTVRNAVYGIQRKLGVASKQEIVVWAVRNGLLDDTIEAILATARSPMDRDRRSMVDIALVLVLRDCGLRRSEAAGLVWSDIER